MRTVFLLAVVGLVLAGCATPAADPEDPPRTATAILVAEDVLLRPGESMRFPYELLHPASSGAIVVDVIGTATRVALDAPDSCGVGVAAPGHTGSAYSGLDCDAIDAGEGALVLRAEDGTLQGRVLFATTTLR